jgi:hypothetical protein
MRKKNKKSEQKLQTRISDYIKKKYPGVMFKCDVAAGMKMSIGMAVLVKRWRSSTGFPDVDIYEPKGQWNMLCLELKTEAGVPFKVDGSLRKNEHLEDQDNTHQALKRRGVMALFTVGFNHTAAVVDWYMAGAEGNPPEYVKKKDIELF